MNSIIEFLNQPIILTLISLVVGSFLLSFIAEQRSRNDRLKNKAIEFLTEVGSNINTFIATIYGQLRVGKIQMTQEIADGMKVLASTNLSVQVSSQAYLKSEEFYQNYSRIVTEYGKVIFCIQGLQNNMNEDETIKKVIEYHQQLKASWPLADEIQPDSSGKLVDEFLLWMDMITARATNLITTNLKTVMR